MGMCRALMKVQKYYWLRPKYLFWILGMGMGEALKWKLICQLSWWVFVIIIKLEMFTNGFRDLLGKK